MTSCLFFSLNKGFYFIISVSCVCWCDQPKQNRVSDRTCIDFQNSSTMSPRKEEERIQSANTPAFWNATLLMLAPPWSPAIGQQ